MYPLTDKQKNYPTAGVTSPEEQVLLQAGAQKAAAQQAVNQQTSQPPATPVSPDVQAQVAGKQQANSGDLAGRLVPNMFTSFKKPVQQETPIPTQSTTQPVQQPQQVSAPEKKTKVPSMGNATRTPSTGMDYLASMFTPPEDEERMRKASLANMKILALGDALRHIGNIYHTTKYAPNQQFNNPALEQWQQYQQGKAVRDAANRHYLAYQQQKAAQDARNKQWEMDFNLKVADAARKAGVDEARIQNMKDRLAEDRRRNDLAHGLNEKRLAWQKERGAAQDKETARHHRVSEGQGAQRINLQKQRFEWQKSGGGHGSNVPPLDAPGGPIQPSGSNYGNQLLQMWNYAKDEGLVSDSDIQQTLRDAGYGKETPDNAKRAQILGLLRTNKQIENYALTRLKWKRGASNPASDWSKYAEDDWDDYAE